MRTPKIRFQGEEFLLINADENHQEGSIATEEQFRNNEPSFAHLFKDGRVMRRGHQIGTIQDVEFLDDVDLKMTHQEVLDLFERGIFSLLNGGWR